MIRLGRIQLMKNIVWTTGIDDENKRLDFFLREKIPLELKSPVSNSKIRRLIMTGLVSVQNSICKNPSLLLKKGKTVQAFIDEEKFFYEKKANDIDFVLTEKDVLFEDESLIIVNKPAFIPTEETIVEGRSSMHSALVDYLWKKNPSLRNPPYAGIMHRLDHQTSGVLLFTKTRSVNAAVHEMFEKHTAIKIYIALTSSSVNFKKGDKFSLDNFTGRISAKSQACKIGALPQSRGGKRTVTDFTVLEKNENYLLVECCPLTGRTHQIRVHLSQKGIPIIGDTLYGGKRGFEKYGERIMLHARSLSFPHPVTGKIMTVFSPLPEEFNLFSKDN